MATNTSTMVQGLQVYTVFKGVTSLVYAGLWLGWLNRISNAANSSDSMYSKCKDISPTWRALLYILAWIGVIGTAIYACALTSRCILSPDVEIALITIATIIIVFIYIYQIQYIDAVAISEQPVGQCNMVSPWRRQIVTTFALVITLFSVLLIGFGIWGKSFFETMAKELRKKYKKK